MTYHIRVAGVERDLPLCPINEELMIAAFVMFSDVELTQACAAALAEKLPPCDYLLTAEAKGIPLAYEMSRIMGIPYVVARKAQKAYMPDPLCVTVQSITTAGQQKLYLSREKAAWLAGKRVAIVDDVISTGGSIQALESLAAAADSQVVCRAAVLAEGSAEGYTTLGHLPLFDRNGHEL